MSRNVETLVYEIQELYIEGSSARQIARQLGTDVDLVLAIINEWGASDFADDIIEGEYDTFVTVNS
jgi:hypothetical protein